jgi:hypothetical protein
MKFGKRCIEVLSLLLSWLSWSFRSLYEYIKLTNRGIYSRVNSGKLEVIIFVYK